MKSRIVLFMALSTVFFTLSACSIEGEELCGVWNTKGESGEMQVEITPWKGKFLGYLLEYNNGAETITGKKSEEYIFITDLEYHNKQYQNGKIFPDPDSKASCGLTLELLTKDQVRATYNCDGTSTEEVWYRKGSPMPATTMTASAPAKTSNEPEPTKPAESESTAISKTEKTEVGNNIISSAPQQQVISNKIPEKPAIIGQTQKQSAFYVIGIQKQVGYEDFKAMEKAIEDLWTEAYNNDFSGKIKNIAEPNSIYVSYSSYDRPKGKVTITLGYKVKEINDVPAGLKSMKVPSNDFLVYPLSGKSSDFEGDGWEQLAELIMHRKPGSADFEVYTFDSNFNVKKAEMWVATL